MAEVSPVEAFESLHRGEGAPLSYAEARLDLAYWLGVHPLLLRVDRLDPERALEGIEAVRSWAEVRPEIEGRLPEGITFDPEATVAAARTLLEPPKRKRRASPSGVRRNRLWSKTSY